MGRPPRTCATTSRRTSPATRCRARSCSSRSCRATPPARSSSASSSSGATDHGAVAAALEIRRATAADVPALRALGIRAWRSAYRGLLAPAAIDAAIAEWWNEYSLGAACRDGRMLVASRGGAPAGLLESDRMADGRAVVWKVCVAPEAQRSGVGRALVERCAEALHPSEELWLEHYAVDAAAAGFWERL